MTELLIVPVVLVGAVVVGLWLYGRYAAYGTASISIAGILRNALTLIIGVFLLMTGMWPLILLGGLVIIIAVFLGATHAKNLDESTSLRRRLAG